MKPQSLLFTIYGEYVRAHGGEIWIGSLTKLLGQFGISEQAVRAAISRMQRLGWLESRKIGNRSYYSMSRKGTRRLNEAAARIYKQAAPDWDGRWCIVSYSIPEARRELRDQLRKELAFAGFGPLGNSTWISSRNLIESVRDLIESYGLSGYVEIFRAAHVGWSEPRQLVAKCWDLASINAAYQSFIDQFRPQHEEDLARFHAGEPLPDGECFVKKTNLVHQYRKFLFIDPDLPDELLPKVWLGTQADELFAGMHGMLNPGAERFFQSVFETAPQQEGDGQV